MSEASPDSAPGAPSGVETPPYARVWPARSDVLMVGFWALMASVLGRGLAPALPGSTAGIGQLIVGVEELGAFASQFLVMMGTAVCVRLLLSTLDCRSFAFRPTAIVCSAAALPVVISASSRHLPVEWLIGLVGFASTMAFVAAVPMLRALQSRAAGLVVIVVTLGSLVSAAGRIIALYASQAVQAPLFGVARGVATAGLVLDALSVGLVMLWLAHRWRLRGVWLVGTLVGFAALIVWMGLRAGDADAWGLVAGRALASLTAHPDPFIGSGFRYFIEVFALLLAAITLWFQHPVGIGATLSFALLARVSADVPLCAMMLMLAALSGVRASLLASRPGSLGLEPSGRRAPLEVVPVTR